MLMIRILRKKKIITSQDKKIDSIFPYGAVELKESYSKNMTFGICISTVIHLILIWLCFQQNSDKQSVRVVRITKYRELEITSSIASPKNPIINYVSTPSNGSDDNTFSTIRSHQSSVAQSEFADDGFLKLNISSILNRNSKQTVVNDLSQNVHLPQRSLSDILREADHRQEGGPSYLVASQNDQRPEKSFVNSPAQGKYQQQIPWDNQKRAFNDDGKHSITDNRSQLSSHTYLETKNYDNNSSTYFVPQIDVDPKNSGPNLSAGGGNGGQSNWTGGPGNPKFPSIDGGKLVPDQEIFEVPLISSDKISHRTDLSINKSQLVQWMKKNSYEFDVVTKRFLMYDNNDLMSKITFRNKNRIFDLYILCKENSLETRICLIEDNQLILLIDNGFIKHSDYLRIGRVERSGKTIVAFSTSQRPASEETTFEFYRIFLSWWEQIENKNQ